MNGLDVLYNPFGGSFVLFYGNLRCSDGRNCGGQGGRGRQGPLNQGVEVDEI
jgi:hypothetical protein